MAYETIAKPDAASLAVRPNLADYEAQRATFSWPALAQELDGLLRQAQDSALRQAQDEA